MIKFQKFDVLSLSESEWKTIHQYRRQVHLQDTPEEPIVDDKTFEEQMKGQIQIMQAEFYAYGIYDDQKFVGLFFFGFFKESSPSYKTNEKIAIFQIEMLQEYRRRGIGTEAIGMMIEPCEKNNKSIFITNSQIPETIKFFDAIGAKIAQRHEENKLTFSELDWGMIDQWIKEAEQLNPKTRLETIIGPIPDKYIDEFLKSYDETAKLQPKDDLEMGDFTITKEEFRKMEQSDKIGGIVPLTIFTIEENGEVSGLTQLRRVPGKEKLLSQNLTGVPIKYRGRKLGKWVKAAMVKMVKEKYPDAEGIVTGNAESNAAMLHINRSLGFKKYKENVMAQVTLDQLKLYINSKSE